MINIPNFKKITIVKNKKILIPIIIITSLIVSVIGIYIYSQSIQNSLSPRESFVDLSYEKWDKTYSFENSKISNENGFIRIVSRDFYKKPSAILNFQKTKKITLNFKIRTPELSMVKDSGLHIRSRDTVLIAISNKGRWDAIIVDGGQQKIFGLLPVLDRNWHSIKIELEILESGSKVTIVFDDRIIVENLNIKVSTDGIDNIFIYGGTGKNTPNITDFIFESLIITLY